MSSYSTSRDSLQRAPRFASSVVLGLIFVFLFSAVAGLAPAASAAPVGTEDSASPSDAPGSGLKAVIIVGPTHGLTSSNLKQGEALAQLAESQGMDVRRVFHPKATWTNVLKHIQGANLVAYFGHGNGWPSRYSDVLREKTQNGFGLNPFEGASQSNVEYWGGNKIRNSIVLAEGAVVLLNHLCYAAGNGESDDPIPGWSVAHKRVENFASAFLTVGASSVFAYSSQPVSSVLQALLTTDRTIEQIFQTTGSQPTPHYGFIGWDARKLESTRNPGAINYLDPHSSSGFQRAVSGNLSVSAAEWRSGSASSGGSGGSGSTGDSATPDTTLPSTPANLQATALGYRRVELSWDASSDDRAGTIRYRILRNGTRIATVTTLKFVDRPANAGTYSYKVRALDAAGNKSPFTPVVKGEAIKGQLSSSALGADTTAPSVPSGLQAKALGYRRIELSWQASTDDRPGSISYRIFRNGTRIATVTTLTFTDRPAAAGTYSYKVRAVDQAGNKSAFSVVVKGQAIKGPL